MHYKNRELIPQEKLLFLQPVMIQNHLSKEETKSYPHLVCSPLDHIRIGLIGLGNRGLKTLERYTAIEHVTVSAVCDVDSEKVDCALQLTNKVCTDKPLSFSGKDGWKSVCELPDVNLIFVCTDWSTHARIACYAMECSKHVVLEVPAAMSVDDCWKLVHTAEKAQRYCMIAENCCYDPYNLMALNLAQNGLLGNITHAEGAYIHNLKSEYMRNGWMKNYSTNHVGNFYPTHGLGPICQQMDIGKTDQLDYLVSVSANCQTDNTPPINTTIIHTTKGRTIVLTYDVTTMRPYSRVQMLCGSKGYICKYPTPTLMLEGFGQPLTNNDVLAKGENFKHPFTKSYEKIAQENKIKNEMNYIMDHRLISCLLEGLPLDIDVYDAALWSCITELTEQSVRLGGQPVKIPNFRSCRQ